MSSTSFLGSNNNNIIYMQYDNSYIGVGCYDPTVKMEVAGDVQMRSNMRVYGAASFSNVITLGSNNANVTLSTSNANLGVSVAAPIEKLDVGGKVQTSVQFLAPQTDDSNMPGFTFSGNSNTGMFHAATNSLGFTTAGSERVRIDASGNIGIALSNPSATLDVAGTTLLRSNVTILGSLSVSNVTYVTSNVFIYSSETVNNNLTVGDSFTACNQARLLSSAYIAGPATFSNILVLGSNNGQVLLGASNGMLGINLSNTVAPRADLDISNGNILARNFQKLSKTFDNSNPIAITINWDNAFSNNNLYHVVADVYQSIANADQAGFRTQRVSVGVSNSVIQWVRNADMYGSSTAYQTLNLGVQSVTSRSITLLSSTNWTAPGSYLHGMNVNVVNFPVTNSIGNLYLS